MARLVCLLAVTAGVAACTTPSRRPNTDNLGSPNTETAAPATGADERKLRVGDDFSVGGWAILEDRSLAAAIAALGEPTSRQFEVIEGLPTGRPPVQGTFTYQQVIALGLPVPATVPSGLPACVDDDATANSRCPQPPESASYDISYASGFVPPVGLPPDADPGFELDAPICTVVWDTPDASAVFYTIEPHTDPCDPQVGVLSHITLRHDWRTQAGLTDGDPPERITALYPNAIPNTQTERFGLPGTWLRYETDTVTTNRQRRARSVPAPLLVVTANEHETETITVRLSGG